jgi:hypothetical protein
MAQVKILLYTPLRALDTTCANKKSGAFLLQKNSPLNRTVERGGFWGEPIYRLNYTHNSKIFTIINGVLKAQYSFFHPEATDKPITITVGRMRFDGVLQHTESARNKKVCDGKVLRTQHSSPLSQ